jgi:transcriptional regulator with XRE-family HTH domain
MGPGMPTTPNDPPDDAVPPEVEQGPLLAEDVNGGLPGDHHASRLQMARKLQEWRKRAGLSQTELAHRLGKRQSYVSRCETGAQGLEWFEMRVWARACGVYLAIYEDEVRSDDPGEGYILENRVFARTLIGQVTTVSASRVAVALLHYGLKVPRFVAAAAINLLAYTANGPFHADPATGEWWRGDERPDRVNDPLAREFADVGGGAKRHVNTGYGPAEAAERAARGAAEDPTNIESDEIPPRR